MKILKPDLVSNSLREINLEYYKNRAMRGMILDLDNTLVPWHLDCITAEADLFLREALALEYRICLLTNASKKRTEKIARQYDLHYLSSAFKPRKKAFLCALQLIGLRADEVLVIGDQVFTDVLGGNRAGCYTILVPALSPKEFIGTKVFRFLEWLLKAGHPYRK
jgi:HAD superfamily phosphatase (TIGR01668 family)